MIETTYHDGIARLTIDMPDRSMNVLTPAFADALAQAVDPLIADDTIKGIVVTSGKSSFIAGADLAQMAEFAEPGVDSATALGMIGRYGDVFRRLETCGKPVVGAATGTALGGGLELLLACHYRVAADVDGAKLGLPEVTLGLLPGAGGTQRLPRMIGIAAAMPILTQGKPMGNNQALEAGILDAVVPAEELLSEAERVIRDGLVDSVKPWDEKRFRLPGGGAYDKGNAMLFMSANARTHATTRRNYPAPERILRCIYEGSALPIDKALRLEQKHFVALVQGEPAQNMIRTLFFARQSADKLARRPEAVPDSKVLRLGVLGAGFMGAGIGQVSALAGIDVVLVDRDRATADQGLASIRAALDKEVDKGRLSTEHRDSALARVSATDGVEAFADCDLVIEAVAEDFDVKATVTRSAEQNTGSEALFASNTSALPIDDLARASARPENFIGLHFFSPVPKMALVEVVVGDATSEATLARALDYVRQIRKTPIVARDGYGFYTTRCVDAYVREGVRLLADGVDPALIENAGVTLGMPVGPLSLADEVGIDVLHHIAHFFASRESGEWADDRHLKVNGVLDDLVAAGRYGRKTGAGFYAYPRQAAKHLDRAFIDRSGQGAAQPNADQVRERLLLAQVLEATRCWADGVISDAGDADLGSVLGWAFPAYLGGPIAVIDKMGLPQFVDRCDALAQQLGARFEVPSRLRELAREGAEFRAAA